LVIPELMGKMDGVAIRVPTPNVSLVDLTCELAKDASKEDLNALFREYAEGKMKGILEYCTEPLVSKDFQNNPSSSIVDAELTKVLDKRLAKVFSWYDNEWGYSCRVVDLCAFIGKTLPVPAHR
jgi:glyceraldehyde 3-phosphate dehydrogenase